MRLFFTLFAGAVISLSATAAPKSKTKSKFTGKFLTYSQLAALPKAKRMGYIRDLTRLLVTMEKANSHYEVAGLSFEDLKEQIAEFQRAFGFLPEAEAKPGAGVRARNGAIPEYDNVAKEWHCGVNFPNFEFVESIPGCVKLNNEGTTYFRGGCDPGTVEIRHPDQYFAKVVRSIKACVSERSLALLESGRRKAIMDESRDPWLDPNGFLRGSLEDQMAIVYGAREGVAPGNDNPAVAGVAPGGVPVPVPAVIPAPATAAPAETVPGGSAAVPKDDNMGMSAPVIPYTPPAKVEAAPAVTAKPPADAKPETAKVEPEKAEPEKTEEIKPDPKADACIPEPKACPAAGKEDAAAIAQFRKTPKYKGLDANVCIAAGMVSKYETSQKNAGSCLVENKWAYKKWKKINGKRELLPAMFNCNADEALCNPALFCHHIVPPAKEGAPAKKPVPVVFCVEKSRAKGGDKNKAYTELCLADYEARLADVKKIKEAPPGSKVEACDPFAVDEISEGLKEGWNDLIKKLETMHKVWCVEPDFNALFCRECEIINAQIYKMTKKATGKGCSPDGDAAPAAAEAPKPEGKAEGAK